MKKQTNHSKNQVGASATGSGAGISLSSLVGLIGLIMAMSMQVTPQSAQAAIADSPLYLTGAAEPNVMFVIDDSGSMHFEMMPEELIENSAYYVFPRASGVYGAGDYTNRAPTVDSNNPYNALARSPQVNTLYYNPAITYTPWVRHDNTLYPNATPSVAYHNPENTGAGSRNLTASNTDNISWTSCTAPDTCSTSTSSKTYWPATYYWHNGGSVWNWANYTQVEIRNTTPTYTGHGRASRTDCTAGVCTYAQEIQNFANWYTYYRSRILAARAGIGRAFAQQSDAMRVGFGAINHTTTGVDNVSVGTVVRGVRKFTAGTNRQNFFSDLYTRNIPTSGTPLRRALDQVGQYYSSTDNRGPWGAVPGTNNTAAHMQCRQSYTVLMTDGYWSGQSDNEAATSAARDNVDGTGGPTHAGLAGASYTYSAVSPFTDNYSNTLADVAMYYWKNDLRPDLDNAVPVSSINPAFWQHMSTFGVGLGVSGTIDPEDAFDAIGTTNTITWPNTTPATANCSTTTMCQARSDDLLHAAVNGRGGFFSAADPTTFATELSNVLNAITSRISSAAAVASNSTRLTSSTHLYQALFNSGDWSGNLKAFPLLANGTVGSEVWDAANGIPAHGSRNIKTWNGSAGADFSGAVGNLTASEVSYLRGDTSNEVRNSGSFRNRSSLLGDIVNADPHYAHNENFGYNTLPNDPGLNYPTFLLGKADRTPIVYAAANDGMLHAFGASDGVELFAYVPRPGWVGATPKLRELTQPNYSHKYFVDGSPTTWDAWWGTTWKTVLAGGLGAGGKGVYALNVSDPDNFDTSSVLWEFNGGDTPDDMGHVMGPVTVARFADGNFWAVFGNGYQSTSGKSVLFMVRMDSPSTVIRRVLDNGTGNGLSAPILVDQDGDRVIDLIYAGDLKGNLWKVDVTSSNTNSWGSFYRQGATPKALFIAQDGLGNRQPITATPEVGRASSPAAGLMVYVGTGRYHEVGDNATTTVQTMYGVLDNGPSNQSELLRANLQPQSIVIEGTISGTRVRAMSSNNVNYGTQKGWYIDLLTPPSPGTAKGERVISGARLFGGKLIFQTIVPSLSPCDYGGASWLMQVNPATGSNPLSAGYDVNNDGLFNTDDQIDLGGGVMANVSGVDTGVGLSGGFGVPISAGDKAYVPLSGTAGNLGTTGIASGQIKPRASWRQIQ